MASKILLGLRIFKLQASLQVQQHPTMANPNDPLEPFIIFVMRSLLTN
jgi:hypothetical protein